MAPTRRPRPMRLALLAGLALVAAPLRADDLRDALTSAYATNPTIQAARANQRALDETVPLARANGLPSLSGQATLIEFVKRNPVAFTAPMRTLAGQVNLGVPVYSGGAVRNAVEAAETRVGAGQQDLRGTEAGLFSQVVAVYMDVIRDAAIVGLNRHTVEVLEVNLKATTDRYEIGDLTRTDVAQSQSRLALARGDLRNAEVGLVSSRERYIQIVGKAPADLAPPPPLPGMPATPDEAVDFALEHNPDLLAARERSKAAKIDVRVAEAAKLPTVSVNTQGAYQNTLGTLGTIPGGLTPLQQFTTAQASVSLSVPLFQGGRPAAQTRQAQAREGAALESEIAAERAVISGVRSAFAQWRAANEIIAMNQTAVDAAALSLEGVKAENSVGNRTILNILDAEQELLRAQVQLVAARRNAYVAGFNLLSAMGKADADDLGLDGGALYDPQTNYERVRHRIFDWDKDPEPVAHSTRTADTPAQDATSPVKSQP
ncbi:TolC family outer membrane protein [Novosphingobium flavum]|uniref:TolC family outer membrane protein n=1 Tax=Novosphingobium aerophilum TaxID=2839843 RepID=A0A7X1F908_9SPHN|nr:TolC family outer membrane protein [Novosphingobium aerophilum]MBC2652607.1 TolC family outer membrane protein [Novosphingobium aerophilum]MBC2662414.1 TolC family outer membrane protein [Novosphingobium aerophilum]